MLARQQAAHLLRLVGKTKTNQGQKCHRNPTAINGATGPLCPSRLGDAATRTAFGPILDWIGLVFEAEDDNDSIDLKSSSPFSLNLMSLRSILEDAALDVVVDFFCSRSACRIVTAARMARRVMQTC